MKQHILVISQYFYPEEFRINDICREWVKKGYEVTVVTGIPNYPQGKFFKGYGWFRKRREEYEGIHIIRIPIISRGSSAVRLMLNYISYVVSGFFWKTFTGIKADKVFIFEVSPMTQALAGVWYAKRRKVPCYIYVQDLWPENVEIVTGIRNKTVIGMIDRMVNYIYHNCQKIFATSPSFVKKIEERPSAFENNNSKVLYWPQYAEEFYKPVEKKPLQDIAWDDVFKIAFTGNIGYAQGLDILPRVAQLLQQQQQKCCFYIIGDGRYRKELERDIEARGVSDMFRLLGRKKPEEIPDYLAYCDAAFISFANNPLFEMTIPAKLQSYMACGMPIIAAASGETKRVIEEAKCGICCKLGDENELLKGITSFMSSDRLSMQNMKENALAYCKKNFDKKQLLDELDSIYEERS